ncbi:MAG: hypothetical protein IMF10_00880, partial [Proteobacteria bacterium]|nr:hypothetical protein [Pseudomonadota bacterium]
MLHQIWIEMRTNYQITKVGVKFITRLFLSIFWIFLFPATSSSDTLKKIPPDPPLVKGEMGGFPDETLDAKIGQMLM